MDFEWPSPVSRAQRLLDLIQLLRRHRFPVSGASLAQELGVSLRTLYRDIETVKAQGPRIDGGAGVGYVLRPGFMLPPLMFSEEEIEALVLGSRWVAERADAPLSNAARNALAKIVAVLPDDLRDGADATGLLVGPGHETAAGDAELATIRQAIRTERKLSIAYVDQDDIGDAQLAFRSDGLADRDRKSTRLNSSHANISYAVFCLQK